VLAAAAVVVVVVAVVVLLVTPCSGNPERTGRVTCFTGQLKRRPQMAAVHGGRESCDLTPLVQELDL
jgi:hypothetical protein